MRFVQYIFSIAHLCRQSKCVYSLCWGLCCCSAPGVFLVTECRHYERSEGNSQAVDTERPGVVRQSGRSPETSSAPLVRGHRVLRESSQHFVNTSNAYEDWFVSRSLFAKAYKQGWSCRHWKIMEYGDMSSHCIGCRDTMGPGDQTGTMGIMGRNSLKSPSPEHLSDTG